MKIGVFGGAFNPPHTGHVNAAEVAAKKNNIELLLVIPTGISPHKTMPKATPNPDVRLKMTENAFNGLSVKTHVSDIEIYSEDRNYTIDTIRKLQNDYPGADFCLLVGDDMYDSLDTWKDSKALLGIVTPVLLPRDVISISSTELRLLLSQRKGTEYLCEKNYSLIIKHRLYDAKPDFDWLREKAHSMLDEKRIPHVDACEVTAAKLAVHWGENEDDAREAAILHDVTKRLDFDENLCIIAEHGLVTNNYKKSEEKLLHSFTASLLAKSEFGVSDKVVSAIRLHTTGAACMSLLDKIIYVADYMEPTRDFPGVDELRKAAYENIDKAMAMGLQMTVDDLMSRGIEINKSTCEALNTIRAS